jgi:hypothetical protein
VVVLDHPALSFLKNNFMSNTKTGTTAQGSRAKTEAQQAAIKDFFDHDSPERYQQKLFQLMFLAITSDGLDDWDAITRSNLFFFYKQLHNLIAGLSPQDEHTFEEYWDVF